MSLVLPSSGLMVCPLTPGGSLALVYSVELMNTEESGMFTRKIFIQPISICFSGMYLSLLYMKAQFIFSLLCIHIYNHSYFIHNMSFNAQMSHWEGGAIFFPGYHQLRRDERLLYCIAVMPDMFLSSHQHQHTK